MPDKYITREAEEIDETNSETSTLPDVTKHFVHCEFELTRVSGAASTTVLVRVPFNRALSMSP
jgi:hypothetical protein